MLSNKVIRLIVPILLFASFIVWSWSDLIDELNQYLLRENLDKEVQAFVKGISGAQANAAHESRRYGVEITTQGWNVFLDQGSAWHKDTQDVTVGTGVWGNNTKIGKLLVGPIFFDKGACFIDSDTICNETMDDEVNNPSVIAITSDARRIYTLYLKKMGETELVYDDY